MVGGGKNGRQWLKDGWLEWVGITVVGGMVGGAGMAWREGGTRGRGVIKEVEANL